MSEKPDRKKIILGVTGAAVTAGSFTQLGGEVLAQTPPDTGDQAPQDELPGGLVDIPDTSPAPITPSPPEGYDSVSAVYAEGYTLESLASRFQVDLSDLEALNPDPTATTFFVPLKDEQIARNRRLTSDEVEERRQAAAVGEATIHSLASTGSVAPRSYSAEIQNDTNKSTGVAEDDREWWEKLLDNSKAALADLVLRIDEFVSGGEESNATKKESTPTPPISGGGGGGTPHVRLHSFTADGYAQPIEVNVPQGVSVTVTVNGQPAQQIDQLNSSTPITVYEQPISVKPQPSPIETPTTALPSPSISHEIPVTAVSYKQVLDVIPDFEDLPQVEAVKHISVYAPNGLRDRSVAYQDKIQWLHENSKGYLTPETYFAFVQDGIDTTLGEKDPFAGERSSRKLSGTCVTLHWMAGMAPDAETATRYMRDREGKQSANYFLMRDGSLSRAMPDEFDVAYHAGPERNYDCWGIEIEGYDLNDFSVPGHVSLVNWVVKKHRENPQMKLERGIVEIEMLGMNQYHDYDVRHVEDRSIFGTVNGHGEIRNARGKIDPTSAYVNQVFKDAVALNKKIDEYIAAKNQRADSSSDSTLVAYRGESSLEKDQSQKVTLRGVELNDRGEAILKVVSPLGRDFTVNDSHLMHRPGGYANGKIRYPYDHWGWDVQAVEGEEVFSPITGKLHIFYEDEGQRNAGMGNVLIIEAENGEVIQLGHLGSFVNGLVDGQLVQAGDPLAFVGDSGVATGPLLDIKVARFGNKPIVPFSGPSSGAEPLNPAMYFFGDYVTYNYGPEDNRGINGLAEGEQRAYFKLLEEYRRQFGIDSGLAAPTTEQSGPVHTYGGIPGVSQQNGQTFNTLSISRPTIVTPDQYRLMRDAASRLTGDSNNALMMYANKPRVLRFANPVMPQVDEAVTLPESGHYMPSSEIVVGDRNVQFELVPGWQEQFKALNPSLSPQKAAFDMMVIERFFTLRQQTGATFNPIAAAAQAIGESGHGTSDIFLNTNNPLGMTTSRNDPGGVYMKRTGGVMRAWKKFPSVDEALKYYMDRVTNAEHYRDGGSAPCFITPEDYLRGLQHEIDANCEIIKRMGEEGVMSYAPDIGPYSRGDSYYEDFILNLIDDLNLNRIARVTVANSTSGALSA